MARQNADTLRVVGLGTQDDFGQAESFVDRNGTATPLMTWDETFDTWSHYDVRSQPQFILLDPAGEPLGQWRGLADELLAMIEGA